jgi:restriction endonuclease S subunit
MWVRTQLKDVAAFRSGQRDTNTAVAGGEFPFFVCSSEVLRCDQFDFDDEAVVMAGNNADGIFHLHHFVGKFAARQRTYVITPSTDRLDCRWLFHQLTLLQPQFQAAAIGTTTRYVTIDMLRSAAILLPDVKVQRAISRLLSDVDALLGGLDRLIAKKRDLKQAAMQQLLTGQTRLPGFHGEWEVKPFGEVLARLNAKAYQIQTSDYQATGKYPVVDQGKEQVIGFSDIEEKCLRCPDGGVIVFGDHTCFVKFIDFDFLVGADGTQILLGKAGQNTRFHAFQLQFRGVVSTGYNRHFKFLKEREFVAPPLFEQTAIAAVLSDIDAELSALEGRRDKTRDLKQAMMQELLTGKTRLVPAGGVDA